MSLHIFFFEKNFGTRPPSKKNTNIASSRTFKHVSVTSLLPQGRRGRTTRCTTCTRSLPATGGLPAFDFGHERGAGVGGKSTKETKKVGLDLAPKYLQGEGQQCSPRRPSSFAPPAAHRSTGTGSSRCTGSCMALAAARRCYPSMGRTPCWLLTGMPQGWTMGGGRRQRTFSFFGLAQDSIEEDR